MQNPNQVWFIQYNNNQNGNITTATQTPHYGDNNWQEVLVDRLHLQAFANNYNEVHYDPNAAALVYPDGFKADAVIDSSNKGIIKGMQDQIAKLQANQNNDDDVQPETITDSSVYGVAWNRTAGNTLGHGMTRIDSAVGMNATYHNGINDFTTAGPWNWTTVTDKYGNKFRRIPKVYLKKTKTGSEDNGKITWEASLIPFPGSYLPRCFVQYDSNHNAIGELPYVDVGVYAAGLSGSQLISKPNVFPLVNHGITDFRNYARNDGAGYQLLDTHVWDLLRTLFVIEFGTLQSDTVFRGRRSGNSPRNTGVTDSLPGNSGQTSDQSFKLNGIEDMYSSNLTYWLDGLNFDVQTGHQLYVCDDANAYASQFYAYPYQHVGYTWQWSDAKDEGFDPKHPEVNLNDSTNAAPYQQHQYFCDWQGGWTGNTVPNVGSTWNGADDGLFYVYASTPTTAWANGGCRLVKKASV